MTYQEISTLVTDENEDFVYISDLETYQLIYINHSLLQKLGNPKTEDWYCKPCYEVLQGKHSPCDFCTNHRLEMKTPFIWKHYNKLLNCYFILRDKLIQIDGKKYRMETATDITDQELASRHLEQQLHTEKTLISCIRTLNSTSDIRQAINELLSIIGTYYLADRAYIFESDVDKKTLSNTYEWCRSGVEPQMHKLQKLPIDCVAHCFRRFDEEGELYIVSVEQELEKDSKEYHLLTDQGVKSLMAAPLCQGTLIKGFLGVDNPTASLSSMLLMRSVSSFIVNDLKQRRLMNQLTDLGYTDSLTGLGNRHKYIHDLAVLSDTALKSLGVINLDINGLKAINDTRGQKFGDFLIKHTGDVLSRLFGKYVYRIGSDEFIVFCVNDSHDTFQGKIYRLRQLIKNDENLRLSIGYSWRSEHIHANTQISYANDRMYIDKQTYYGKDTENISNYHASLSRNLAKEIKAGSFCVFLQPQVDLNTGNLRGAEALVRKIGPDGTIISPINFIPRYETEGIIRHLDFFVFKTVCHALKHWKEKNYRSVKISVNLSRITLMEHNIAERLSEICKKNKIDTDEIYLEVTESVGTMAHSELQTIVSRLINAGFSISLDDFGSEYSNLAILTALDFHELKLDKSLIDHVETNDKSRIVAAHAIEMCKDLHLTTVAEGIETKKQRDLMAEMNCSIGQGYYFDRPIPLLEFEQKYLCGQSPQHL